jgi:hypothetical protein
VGDRQDLLDKLVFMCNDASSGFDGILCLVQDRVGSIVWIGNNDSLLRHGYAKYKRNERKEREDCELHAVDDLDLYSCFVLCIGLVSRCCLRGRK